MKTVIKGSIIAKFDDRLRWLHWNSFYGVGPKIDVNKAKEDCKRLSDYLKKKDEEGEGGASNERLRI